MFLLYKIGYNVLIRPLNAICKKICLDLRDSVFDLPTYNFIDL